MSLLRDIGTIYDPEEAYVAHGFLRANGFHALLDNVAMLGVDPTMRVALGGHRLLVPAAEAEEASALLRAARAASNKAARPCPACGGEDYRRPKGWLFPAAFLFLFGAIAPFARNSGYLECRHCKTRIDRNDGWEQEPHESHQTHP